MNSLICTKIKIVIKLLYKSSFSVRERKGERERERERDESTSDGKNHLHILKIVRVIHCFFL
jgi:hypothetical protein